MQNRREFLKTLLFGSLFVGTGLSPLQILAKKGITQLTILHTNDCHSQIEPFPDDHPEYPNMGGFPERASLINDIRRNNPSTLLFDAGDIFQGTPYFNYFSGELEIKLMNEMKYNAATIGNHEFDNGLENLANQIDKANFPFISSNYDFSDTPLENLVKKYLIINKNGIKIGLLGLGIELEGLVSKKNSGNTIYKDPIKEAQQQSDFLKHDMKCDLIICLSHLGHEYKGKKVSDVVIAQNSSNIDLIIGGHTHKFLDQPLLIANRDKKEVRIVQSGWAGIKMGRIDYYFDNEKHKSVAQNTVINILKSQG